MDKIIPHIEEFGNWFITKALDPIFYLQGFCIALVMVLSWLIYRFLKPRTEKSIDRLRINYRFHAILHNTKVLIFPAIAIFIFSFIELIEIAGLSLPFGTGFIGGAINLLAAWIVIRILVQFIENRTLRNTVALIIWTIAALNIIGALDETTTALDAVGMSFGEFRISALTVVKGLIALFALIYAANIFSALVERNIKKSKSLTPATKVLISKVVRIALIAMAILIGVTTAGIDLSLLAVFSGAVGLGIGFGLQKVISNLFSGLLLLIDQSITPGDIIELPDNSGTFGWVHKMGARYTEIVTRDNKSFLIPNEDFITQQVVNWSHGDTLVRVEVHFGVSYNADPHEVRAIASEAASKPERVVSEPSPVCHIIEFGDSSVNYTLRFWIKDAEHGVTNAKGEVLLSLWDALKENNINIPYPHREVFIHNVETPPAKKAPAKKSTAKSKTAKKKTA